MSLSINQSLLSKYKDPEGNIDYIKIKTDTKIMTAITELKDIDTEKMSLKEELSFWLNAYNLLTIHSVLIELDKNPSWRGNMTLFSKLRFFIFRKHKVANKSLSLYHLENKILRKKFKDPRIHFALNCGSKGCPIMPDQLFTAKSLDTYLDELTYDFINNQQGVKLQDNTLVLNPIFKWYKKDFQDSEGLIAFISKYYKEKIPKNIKITYSEYDWSLNST